MEEIVANHEHVVECAVVGASDELKGEMPVAFVVTRSGVDGGQDVVQGIVTMIREGIGPIATPRTVLFVDSLPKTRSGKVLRNLLRSILNGDEIVVPQTIEDASVIEKLLAAVE